MQLALPVALSVEEAKELIVQAVKSAESISSIKEPEVQVTHYGLHSITYQVKYWVPQYDREPQCRNELLSLIDAALRAKEVFVTQAQNLPFCLMEESGGRDLR